MPESGDISSTSLLDPFAFGDELGPDKVIFIHQAQIGLRAIVVVDNVACGPAIGGVRLAPDVTAEECFRLARAMTLKNAAAQLPHGGGKAVIIGSSDMAADDKERLMRAFALAIADIKEYIPGPDMGTNETAMAWVWNEIGRSVGLPRELGGIPLDEIGATGFGVAVVTEEAARTINLNLDGARLAVQGFGAVGIHSARFLAERGVRLVAATDSRGGVANEKGLPLKDLVAFKVQGGSLADSGLGRKIECDEIVDVDCDIWIPAARPDVIDEHNVDRLRTRLVVEGANIPITESAEKSLHARGTLVVPDFIANAGGVICAAIEYQGGNENAALEAIEEKLRRNTRQVLERSATAGVYPRVQAMSMARERVEAAMQLLRFRRRM